MLDHGIPKGIKVETEFVLVITLDAALWIGNLGTEFHKGGSYVTSRYPGAVTFNGLT